MGKKLENYCYTLALLFSLGAGFSAEAATNSWIKPIDGKWEGAQAWSLGVAPNSSQSVVIDAAVPRVVTIDPLTIANRPLTMSVMDLTIAKTNTLRINNPGTDNPLQIENFLRLGPGAIAQNGGSVGARVINMVSDGIYSLTNGQVNAANIEFLYSSSEFYQQGGITRFGGIRLNAGHYTLADGQMIVADSIWFNGLYGTAKFSQLGGTNRTGSLSMYPTGTGGSPMQFELSGGWLFSGNVRIGPRGSFIQTGGRHAVDGSLTLEGSTRYYPWNPAIPAFYTNSGYLMARNLEINEYSTFASSGTNTISESIRFIGRPGKIGALSISGGLLASSNVENAGGVVDIVQAAGNFTVTNLFSFTGCYVGGYNGAGARFGRFDFSGGTFTANNVELGAEWIIGSSSQAGRISNPGYFKMAGILRVGGADEQLGRFILASNAIVDLGLGSAKLAFATSHAEVWNSAATLTVTNWEGALSGGGYDQLKFGSSGSGLDATQLTQIRFVNPAGLPPGIYLSRILSTGEVVPVPTPAPGCNRERNSLILTWSSEFALQAATNVVGPYLDIATTSTSYTNRCDSGAQSYFRLRLK